MNPYVDSENAFLDFSSQFFLDDRTFLFGEALLSTLETSFNGSEEARIFAQYLCEDFLDAVPLHTTSPFPSSTLYQLSVDVPDEEADHFAELLLGIPHPRRLQLLFHYLWRFHSDLPSFPVSDRDVIATIFNTIVPQIQDAAAALQYINPSPPSAPVSPVFGPLTLADTPPPALPTSKLDVPLPAPAPAPPITKPATPSALAADTPPAPLTHPQAQTCRLISGRRRRRPLSTWTSPHFKPPRPTPLLHRGLWNHAPWLDPLPTKFHSSSHAGQAFLWLCPPRPREPP